MIRSSKHSTKFTNQKKQETLKLFIKEYKVMVRKFVNILWNEYLDNPPAFLSNDICQSIITNVKNDSKIRQCAAKQACSMVKAIVNKQNKRYYQLAKLQKEGKNTSYLQRKIDKFILTKPKCDKINVELDSRFVDFEDGKSFDLFIQIDQIGNKRKVRIPIKHTFVSNKWSKLGELRPSIRLTSNHITLYYEVEEPEKRKNGVKLGADQGQLTCLSLSNQTTTTKDKDGYDLNKIQDIMSKKKKDSKAFKRCQSHRENYINWSLNQLDFSNVREIGLEKIKNIRKGKRNSRKASHWTFTLIRDKIISRSENEGFIVTEQDNKFMSQRCSKCGWVHKPNRKGKTFKCSNAACKFFADSDLNAASNHEIELPELPPAVWLERINRTTGFFWLSDKVVIEGQESIVPDTKKI